jgi:hypothetical protein
MKNNNSVIRMILGFQLLACFFLYEWSGATIWPIENADPNDISSAFGPRLHGGYDFHDGIDIPAQNRTPVYLLCNSNHYSRKFFSKIQ